MAKSILTYTDSYKVSMPCQYPPGTAEIFAYVEPRQGGRFPEIMFFGLQSYLKEFLLNPITSEQVTEMGEMMDEHFNAKVFNRKIFNRVISAHKGYLPLEVCALPEGIVVPEGTPVSTVRSTDRTNIGGMVMPSLVTYVETSILPAIWYPSTVATISYRIRNIIKGYMELTCDNLDKLPFMLHDFGGRGAVGYAAAGIGGVAHLVSFMGTDNIPALFTGRKYYGQGKECFGYTIPAMEHSTVTSWGRLRESASYRNMLEEYRGTGILACVSDSYDYEHAVENIWGEELRSEVIASGAIVVIRPDSGEAVSTTLWSLEKLAEKYGYTVNSKGYKLLNNVRLIWGDGINEEVIGAILSRITAAGFSTDNVAFGMGGALLQHCDRDWGRWCMKTSQITMEDGSVVMVSKKPKTDPSKASREGTFGVYRSQGRILTRTLNNGPVPKSLGENLLTPVYRDGTLLKDFHFSEVRENAKEVLL